MPRPRPARLGASAQDAGLHSALAVPLAHSGQTRPDPVSTLKPAPAYQIACKVPALTTSPRPPQVGFAMGLAPAAVRLSETAPRTAELAWTPCAGDVGYTSVCLEAFDGVAGGGGGGGSMGSDMLCLQVPPVSRAAGLAPPSSATCLPFGRSRRPM
jgi:hypothetical protein